MEANELRLGNYLHEEGVGQITVESLNSYGGEEINEDSARGWIDPIPLTEEWLLKFGFEFKEEYYFKGPVSGVVFCVEKKDDTLQISVELNPDSQLEELANNPIYVHQLQNLYFVSTGEELTLIS